MKYYRLLDNLPKVPQEYVDLALKTAKERLTPMQNTQNPRVLIRDGKEMSSRTNPRYNFYPIEKWVDENISKEWNAIGVADNIIPDDRSVSIGDYRVCGAHTDGYRCYTLLYLVETGNLDQETIWWQEEGYGIHRKRNILALDFDKLTKLESVQIPLHTWAYLDATVLHSIENIQGSRIAIQVGFDHDVFEVFQKV